MKTKIFKSIAIVVAVSLVSEMCFPLAAYALTSGPSQPEFSSFEPVATTNMVNDFSGSFTYNLPLIQVPGPNGSGYSLSLSYHSGASAEEEASWVGYGWTLNPGSITRNTRGFPDDYHEASVRYYNKTARNWTISVGTVLGIEAFSLDKGSGFNIGGISGNYSLRWNNYRSFGYVAGFNSHVAGLVSFGYSVSDGNGTWSYSINPARFLMNLAQSFADQGDEDPAVAEEKSWSSTFADKMSQKLAGKAVGAYDQMFNFYGVHSYQDNQRPVNVTPYTGNSFNVTTGLQYTGIPFVGLQGQLTGNYNSQQNVPLQTIPAWGYMYSGKVGDNNVMMDYYVEKDVPYTMRDKFLALPFSNADNYMLSGEGLSGGFRLHHAKPGHFRKNSASSQIDIKQVGFEGSIGLSVGVGGDYGTGSQRLEVNEWSDYNKRFRFASTASVSCTEEIDEPYFFRFNNDMGGKVSYENGVWASDDVARRGRGVDWEVNPVVNAGTRSGRASYIAYHTNREMYDDSAGYAKDPAIGQHIHRDHGTVQDGVGEFAVTNEQGNRYVYGLPVYSMKEQTLQYGGTMDGNGPGLITDGQRYRAHYPPGSVTGPADATHVVGEERDQPYANSYLLTEITTPDYSDLTQNGPSADDLGGYVRFAYERRYGIADKSAAFAAVCYKWRIPYSGMLFQRNELSEPNDNTGSVMSGYKEIYYLDTIETKTHYAVFLKSNRSDGLGAAPESAALTQLNAVGTQTLKKLDKIKVYAKGADGVPSSDDKLLQTVCFKYNNSLCKALHNSNGSMGDNGKLTLEKVWFEYEGTVPVRISPYVFGYEYRKSTFYSGILSSDLMSKYSSLVNFGDTWNSTDQNPDYEPCNVDAWGSYQQGGQTRYQRMQHWIQQNPAGNFDPAAWQLKWIRMPSGGEIHVQYEQNDYSYVQDRRALAMVQTASDGSNTPEGDKFFLDVSTSLGGSVDPQDIADMIQTQFVNTQEEMYFKILYSLYDPAMTPGFGNAEIIRGQKRGAEYITGYSRVKQTGVEGGKVFVVFENKPRTVGLELVEAQKAGREEHGDFSVITLGNVFGKILDFMGNFGRTFFDESKSCKNVNWDQSYIRVPIPQPKKGGGIRVKRLVMVDPGLDGSGSGNIYGSEYDYSMIDENTGKKISSGVATNEPGAMREENALVTSLKKRFDQTAYQRATAGKDKEQFEGPVGESILPGASIGYAQVIVKNIHDGVTGNGFTVHEFFTARDYPFDKHYPHLNGSGVAWTDMAMTKDRSQLSLILSNKTTENIVAEQGYRFIVNSMHGQMKRKSTYGGTHSDPASWILSSMQESAYFEPGEKIPMFDGPEKPFHYDTPGKEMEIVFEGRHIKDKTNNFTLEVDVSFTLLPFPIPTAFPTWNKNESELRTHVTTKVVRYPAIQRHTISYQDGIYHLSENVAFHPATGKPLIVRTIDGYNKLNLFTETNHNGAYHGYSFAAEQDYPNMGQKALNERAIIHSSTGTHTISKSGPTLTFTGVTQYKHHTLTNLLFTGDIIDLHTSSAKARYYVAGINTGAGTATLEEYYSGAAQPAISGAVTRIEIVRSGRTNNLAAMAGNVNTYGENKQLSYDYLKELDKRQRIVNVLNNALLRNESERLYGWNTFGVKFRIQNIHSDSAYSLIRPLDEEHAIGMKVSCNSIEFTPRRVVCYDEATPHPLVIQLNSTLDALWGRPVTTASAVTNATVCGVWTPAVTDHRYPLFDPNIAWLQANGIQPYVPGLISAASSCTPWPWGAHFANMSISMSPVTPPGYYGRANKVTGLQSGAGPIKLTSLQIKYGDRDLLRCYVTTGTTCQFTWGFLPDTDAKLSTFASFSGTGSSYAVLTGLFTTNIGKFGQTNKGQLYFDCFLTGVRHFYDLRFEKSALDVSAPATGPGTAIIKSPFGPGRFALSDDGQIVYYAAGSSTPTSISCLEFPNGTSGVPARKNAGPDATRVVAASAQTYGDDWGFSTAEYGVPAGVGLYQSGARGKWRGQSSYLYKTAISDAVGGGTSDRVYKAGIYADFNLFDKTSPHANWVKMNRVTKYSPYGEALEEKDILEIPSTAKFGYRNTVPVLVAKNAANTSVAFVSFEDEVVGGSVVNTNAHSGRNSYALGALATYSSPALTLDAKLKEQGIQVKFWVRTPDFAPVDGSFLVELDRGGTSSFPVFTKIARTGEWTLYEAVYPAGLLTSIPNGSFTVKLRAGNDAVLIDDIRVQPLDAQMTAYVYDANLRVIAIMDDQHFGLYYQYNGEGKLVRKLKETERGTKTIAETHYHSPLVSRSEAFAMMSGPSSSPKWFPMFNEDFTTSRDKSILEQLLENQESGNGSKFDFEKRLTVPDNYIEHLQQQVDSVNEGMRRARPKQPLAPQSDSGSTKQSSNSRK